MNQDPRYFSEDAEQAVLGALLLDAQALDKIDGLSPEDLHGHGHADILEAIRALHRRGEIADVISVQDYLATLKVDVGGYQYLNDLTHVVSGSRSLTAHARIVAEKAKARRDHAARSELVHSVCFAIETAPSIESAMQFAEDAVRKAQSALGVAPSKAKFSLPKGMRASELLVREKVPSDFVLPGFIAGTVGALVAPGSTGKSMLAMELAAMVAGAEVLPAEWRPTKTGRVLILAIEDPENELYNRWSDFGAQLDPSQRAALDHVTVVPLLGSRIDIMEDEHFLELMDACRGTRLLILDTLRRIHSLEEKDSGDMARVVGRLEQIAAATGCAILFLHHTTKAASQAGQGELAQASRGSSVLVDNIRFQMFMQVMTADEAASHGIDQLVRKSFVRAGISKINYGAIVGDVWLRRGDSGILTPTALSAVAPARKSEQKREAWK